jgi:O-antigen/teichoic acid export membrane protein
MTRPGSLARNVFSNWIGLASSVTYALFITPIIVRALDKELYGVWSFLNGLIAYSDLFYLGLGAALVKYVAQFHAKNDYAGMNRLVSVVVLIYGLIGIACFGILIALSPWLPRAFAEPLSIESARATSYTCVLLGAQMLFIFVGSAFAGLICGHDRYDLVNAVVVAFVVVRFVATPLLVRPGHNPMVMLAILTVAVAALRAVALAWIAFAYIRRLSIRAVRPKADELRLLYGFGLQSFFILFAVKLISYTDTIVIGMSLGAASVALYSLPLQLVEYARVGVGGFTGVFLPRLTTLTTKGDLAGVRDAYLSSTRIACFLSGWLVALLIYLGPLFLNRWVGREFGTPVHWVLLYLAVASFAQVLSTQIPFAFYQALDLLAFPAAVLFAEAVANLVLSLWLAPRFGITGVAFATAIPALFVSMVLLPPYLCRRLGLPLRTVVVGSVLPGVLMLAAGVATEWTAGLFIQGESYPIIIGRALISLPVAILLFRWTFPADQQRAIWRLF